MAPGLPSHPPGAQDICFICLFYFSAAFQHSSWRTGWPSSCGHEQDGSRGSVFQVRAAAGLYWALSLLPWGKKTAFLLSTLPREQQFASSHSTQTAPARSYHFPWVTLSHSTTQGWFNSACSHNRKLTTLNFPLGPDEGTYPAATLLIDPTLRVPPFVITACICFNTTPQNPKNTQMPPRQT